MDVVGGFAKDVWFRIPGPLPACAPLTVTVNATPSSYPVGMFAVTQGGGLPFFVCDTDGNGTGEAFFDLDVVMSGGATLTHTISSVQTGRSFYYLVGGAGGTLEICFAVACQPCPAHTVHGHISTVPPSHSGNVSHQHHGQHGHTVQSGCPPHAPGHSAALTADPTEGLDFAVAFNEVGISGPARRGSILQLYGSAAGLFIGEGDEQPAATFTAPSSGGLHYTSSLPEVRLGGALAKVLFSGLAPGQTGVWLIKVLVPEELSPGRYPVWIRYEGEELKSIDVDVR